MSSVPATVFYRLILLLGQNISNSSGGGGGGGNSLSRLNIAYKAASRSVPISILTFCQSTPIVITSLEPQKSYLSNHE